MLSSGLDSSVKLWELSSLRCIIEYTGAGTMGMSTSAVIPNFISNVDSKQANKNTGLKLCLIIPRIMLCSLTKQLPHSVVGMHALRSVNSYFP